MVTPTDNTVITLTTAIIRPGPQLLSGPQLLTATCKALDTPTSLDSFPDLSHSETYPIPRPVLFPDLSHSQTCPIPRSTAFLDLSYSQTYHIPRPVPFPKPAPFWEVSFTRGRRTAKNVGSLNMKWMWGEGREEGRAQIQTHSCRLTLILGMSFFE